MVELQSESFRAIDGMASAYGGCVLAGCSLSLVSGSTYNISAGLVILKGAGAWKVAPFAGASNVNVAVQQMIRVGKTNVLGQYQNPIDLVIAHDYTATVGDYSGGAGILNEDYLLVPTNGNRIRNYIDAITTAMEGLDKRTVTSAEKTTWNSAEANAITTIRDGVSTTYNTLKKLYDWVFTQLSGKANSTHSHAATDVTQTSSYRFTTDAQQSSWDGKLASTEVVSTPSASKVLRLNSASMFPIAVIRGAEQSLSIAPDGTGTILANRGKITITNSGVGGQYTNTYFNVDLPGIVFLGQEIEINVGFSSQQFNSSIVRFRHSGSTLYEFNISSNGVYGAQSFLFTLFDGGVWRLRSDVNNLITTSDRAFVTTTEKGRIPTAAEKGRIPTDTEKTNNANAVLFAIPGAWKTVGAGGTFENGAAVPSLGSGVTGTLQMRLVNNGTRMEVRGRVSYTGVGGQKNITSTLHASIRGNENRGTYMYSYSNLPGPFFYHIYDYCLAHNVSQAGGISLEVSSYYDLS